MKALATTASATREVVERHLAAFASGLDALMADYGEHSVLITPEAIHTGSEEIRLFLSSFLADADEAFWKAMVVRSISVQDEIAFIAWSAPPFVSLASDTLHVRDGLIAVQTFTSLNQ